MECPSSLDKSLVNRARKGTQSQRIDRISNGFTPSQASSFVRVERAGNAHPTFSYFGEGITPKLGFLAIELHPRCLDRSLVEIGPRHKRPHRLKQRSTIGHDVVISSIIFLHSDITSLVGAVRASGVKRYLVVGGAGSLEVAPGKLLVDQPDFPDFVKAEATKGGEYLNYLREIKDLDWTFLSPSALFQAGERTGVFRLGRDELLVGMDGTSWISYEDYSIALLDEIENPKHIQQRFTVGY